MHPEPPLTWADALPAISGGPAQFGGPACVLREKNQRCCMESCQRADGQEQAVTPVESGQTLRVDRRTKTGLFQHRPAGAVTIPSFRGLTEGVQVGDEGAHLVPVLVLFRVSPLVPP